MLGGVHVAALRVATDGCKDRNDPSPSTQQRVGAVVAGSAEGCASAGRGRAAEYHCLLARSSGAPL